MTRAWTLALAGSFTLAALAAPAAVRQDVPPSDEPPKQAAAAPPADSSDGSPAEAPKPGDVKQPAPGFPYAYAPAAPAVAVAPLAVGTLAVPSVVGDYRVGHIHKAPIGRLFGYSLYHPYKDELHAPIRQVVYGGAYARYYAGYRSIYAPNWHEFYVPRYYAPACYGYDPYGPSYYGYGQSRSSYYSPSFYPPGAPGVATAPVPPAPPSSHTPAGFRYTGDPAFFSPYGAGSASYFGVYGSAGY